jgi:hypothetical protein
MLHRDPRWSPLLASALSGENDTGAPVRIDFRDLPVAVPTVWERGADGDSPAVWVNSVLIGERPELLATAIAEGLMLESDVHCTAHSIVAAALASVLWADFIAFDGSLPNAGTWGTITRNRDLLALLNSQPFDPGDPDSTTFGLRLASGPEGNVLPGLPVRAGSFVDYVLESPRVASNDAETSPSPPALTAILLQGGLETGADALTMQIDDDLLSMIDRAFARLITDEEAIEAARALGLTIASANA